MATSPLFDLLLAAAEARDPDERADRLDEAMRAGLPAAAPQLVAAADTPERRRALLLWMRLFPGAVDPGFVATCLADADTSVRSAAVAATRTLPLDGALPALTRGLTDADPSVRLLAVRELGERGTPAALAALPDTDDDPSVTRWLRHFRH